MRFQVRDRTAAIAKGAGKGRGVGGAPANCSLVFKAICVDMWLGHRTETYGSSPFVVYAFWGQFWCSL